MRTYLILLVVILCSCHETKELNSQTNNLQDKNFIEWLSSQKLPSSLDFCGEKIPLEIPEVKERAEREFYINLQSPGQLLLYLKRAGKYFPVFEKIIRAKNMPDDIKYLAVAESALYMARSPKDAVGLWQFIPETGRKMGLQIDDYVDERRNPEKSTEAALKYIMQGYEASKSWILAAAGYNMGHTSVADNLVFQNTKNYFDLFLNEETSRYILRIAVIKEFMKNPNKYGFNISPDDIYKPDDVKIIKCSEAVPNLAVWASEHGTSYKDVKLLNPWILQRKLPPPQKGKIYEIAVPVK